MYEFIIIIIIIIIIISILKWDFNVANSLSMFFYDFIMILLQKHWESSLLQNDFMMISFHHH